jgi:glycosyl hydrolase family 20
MRISLKQTHACGEVTFTRRLFAAGLIASMSIHSPRAAGQNSVNGTSGALPIRGLHLSVSAKRDIATVVEFIRESLPKAGVNTLVLEFNYQFDFQSRPEFANPSALGKEEVQQILKACQEKQIELIPQLNCLGHQSWARRNARLLEKHPEFDETPGKYPNNEGVYCRSYCPLHPEVHQVLFDLMDELAKVCEARAFHIGMDEVFILADPDCPRCKGKNPAQLFADEVKTLHAHLKTIGCRTWMWGDRFLEGKSTGLGKWEASENGTESAIDLVPKDIVICDWHYNKATDTPLFFAKKGFDVVACPWRKSDVALGQLGKVRAIRGSEETSVARHALGMMQTTWCGFSAFAKACRTQDSGEVAGKDSASEAAKCFLALFKAIREKP